MFYRFARSSLLDRARLRRRRPPGTSGRCLKAPASASAPRATPPAITHRSRALISVQKAASFLFPRSRSTKCRSSTHGPIRRKSHRRQSPAKKSIVSRFSRSYGLYPFEFTKNGSRKIAPFAFKHVSMTSGFRAVRALPRGSCMASEVVLQASPVSGLA